MIHKSKSPSDTQKLASKLAYKIKGLPHKKAVIIALEGELGAGKTTFVQGFAKALSLKTKIKSPTFVLIKSYRIQATGYKLFFHIDCYRIKDYRSLLPLGIKDILNERDNIVLIEWAERIKPVLPKKHVKIHINHISPDKRNISISD